MIALYLYLRNLGKNDLALILEYYLIWDLNLLNNIVHYNEL